MNTENFREEIRNDLQRIGIPEVTAPAENADYRCIQDYAEEKQLRNTALALVLVQYLMTRDGDKITVRSNDAATHMAYFRHALSVCRMLIDLHVPVPPEDEDIMLSAALCHVLPENFRFPDIRDALTRQYCLNPAVAEILLLIYRDDDGSDAQRKAYYARVRSNRLAIMIRLADRGNLVEQLYGLSNLSARSYIYETRNYFFPMCIYAKDHYPELIPPVDVMMEKMRCLVEAAEILLGRFESREAELTQQILTMQEENATLKRMIRTLRMLGTEPKD